MASEIEKAMLSDRIQRLPPDVVAQISSSATIVSLNDVVYGLLKNSLDAQATKVNITVDFARGSCTVDDNGSGILPNEFTEQGSLAKTHCSSRGSTSKDTHGRYGTFLASLAAVSLLTISSRHHGHKSHNSMRLHKAEVIARHTPALPEQRFLTFSHGTRVAVSDLFGAMPVRTKQRAMDAERGSHARALDLLKHEVVGLLLAWPHVISTTLRDMASGQSIAFRLPKLDSESEKGGTSVSGHALRASAALTSAQLVGDSFRGSWVNLRASASRISLCGTISLRPIATKRLQFISIGILPLRNERGPNILFEEINRIFSNSSFGVESDLEDDIWRPASVPLEGCGSHEAMSRKDLRLKKGLERWPMFSLHLRFSNSSHVSEADAVDESRDILPKILHLLRAVLHEFLQAHNLHPKSRRARVTHKREGLLSMEPQTEKSATIERHSRSSSLATRPAVVGDLAASRLDLKTTKGLRARSESPFNLWSRSKSGVSLPSASATRKTMSTPLALMAGTERMETSHHHAPPLIGQDGKLLRAPFSFESDTSAQASGHGSIEQGEATTSVVPDSFTWRNPATGKVSSFSPRTGLILGASMKTSSDEESATSTLTHRLSVSKKPTSSQPSSQWVKDLTTAWESPVFPLAEPCIPSVTDEVNDRFMGPSLIARGFSESKMSKTLFQEAEVISQVDRKFILVKVPSNSRDSPGTESEFKLLMVDQHAADERCKVEELMRNYFKLGDDGSEGNGSTWKAETQPLEIPMRFDISQDDANRLDSVASFLSHWGILYQVKSSPQASKDRTVMRLQVSHLPPSILERCRSEPRLLMECLRQEAWKCDEQGQLLSQSDRHKSVSDLEHAVNDHKWPSRFHGCPHGILEMINSRACRSAIMFNDELSMEDCRELVQRLSRCVFPFQCAHGRPSMVPLFDLEEMAKSSDLNTKKKASLRDTLKDWLRS